MSTLHRRCALEIRDTGYTEENVKNTINFAVQVNGKTRDIIVVNKDTGEGEILELILKKSKRLY